MDEDQELLDALGVSAEPKKKSVRSPEEARVVAGFEEILRFVEANGRAPEHGEDRDIFERIYAVRLDRIRASAAYRQMLASIDAAGLLAAPARGGVAEEHAEFDDEELLRELGVDAPGDDDLGNLRHVRSSEDKRAAEEIAERTPCGDFAQFKPLFERVAKDLETGARITRRIRKDAGFLKADIRQGEFFIVGGQTAYVAEVGEQFRAPNGEFDARLRVIYSNGTESNILLRSLARALYKDETSRLVSEPSAGPLFSGEADDDDLASGTIYVLRSKSNHPIIAANRDVIHKIGVTGGDVDARIVSADLDATYLLAGVEIVATYKLFNINRQRLEHTLHRFFAPARLDLEIKDRFGNPVKPREWFLVPLPVINDVVEKIKDETIDRYAYDPATASLVQRG